MPTVKNGSQLLEKFTLVGHSFQISCNCSKNWILAEKDITDAEKRERKYLAEHGATALYIYFGEGLTKAFATNFLSSDAISARIFISRTTSLCHSYGLFSAILCCVRSNAASSTHTRHSFTTVNPFLMAVVCVFLAAKVRYICQTNANFKLSS